MGTQQRISKAARPEPAMRVRRLRDNQSRAAKERRITPGAVHRSWSAETALRTPPAMQKRNIRLGTLRFALRNVVHNPAKNPMTSRASKTYASEGRAGGGPGREIQFVLAWG